MPSLTLTHRVQSEESDCLSACAWMVLHYLGIDIRYRRLTRLLKVGDSGASFHNLTYLNQLKRSNAVSVLIEDGHMDLLAQYIAQGHPVIASVNTVDLPYWNGESEAHAVVVVDLDDATVSLHDPWFEDARKLVERSLFDSAWLRHEYRYAVIQKAA